jgi:acetyl-CoA carboxylase biotin carboxyl carrier protein
MDIRKVKKLIELVKTTNISELEIHEGEESVRITHSNAKTKLEPQTVTVAPQYEVEKPKEPEKIQGHTVKSPMVGTVFLAPSTGAKPFVEIGQAVKKGDTLCIIEAMKMFNQVETDKAGIISACLVDNSHPVEYDQPLFIIEEK